MKRIILILCMCVGVHSVANAQTAAAFGGGAVAGHVARHPWFAAAAAGKAAKTVVRHPFLTALAVGTGAIIYCHTRDANGESPRGCPHGRARNGDGDAGVSTKMISVKDPERDGVVVKYNPVKASNLRKLKANLRAEAQSAGMPPDPPDGCEAHHIVPDLEGRPGLKRLANIARAASRGCVDINGAGNGVDLPGRSNGTSQCKGNYHKTLHNEAYYRNISRRLEKAQNLGGCPEVRSEMLTIKDELIAGKF